MSDDARSEFELRMDWAYQHALWARAVVEEEEVAAEHARLRIDEIAKRLADLEPGPMAALSRRLDLEPSHVAFIWMAVAAAIDGRVQPHLEALGGSAARRGLSASLFATLNGITDGSVAQLVSWLCTPSRFSSSALLVTTDQAAYAARSHLPSQRLITFLRERPEVSAPVKLVMPDRTRLRHDEQQQRWITDLTKVLRADTRAIFVVEGPMGSGRTTAIACAAGQVVVVDAARLATSDVEEALQALRRELALDDRLPVLANVDHLLVNERPVQRAMFRSFVEWAPGPLVVTTTVPGTDLAVDRPLVRLRWDVSRTEVRVEQWTAAATRSGSTIVGDLRPFAHRFRVGPAAIERAVETAQLTSHATDALDVDALAAGLRHNISERLGGLASRVEVRQTWDDLVLGEDVVDQIHALVGRIRHSHLVLDDWGFRHKMARGSGTAALLSGPPGTGKTMVAGLVARELDLELYQVDLSQVVSKWVGETEKNLARVFDAAEEGHALLLFDEADALFGRRTPDAKGALDRYANLEVNYLLQRVEAFGGITILTTNLETAIDPALKRRLAAHLVFSAPDDEERACLWQRQTSTGRAPLAPEIDFDALAHSFPNMTGANIRNAAVSAAFLAAGDGSASITHEHLVRAARAEYRSMGHMISDVGLRRERRT